MIFELPIFGEFILPFLLIFVLVFAILQKSKILGDGKAQVDAIVSLTVSLISIGVPYSREVIVGLMPWLAIGLSVMLVFLIMYGFVAGDLSSAPKWMKTTFGVLSGLFVLIVVIWVTGLWKYISNFTLNGSELWTNLLLLVIIAGAVVFVIVAGKKSSSS